MSGSAAAALALPLRDIHLPPEPAFWPPAPGWWLLAALLLGAGLLLGRRLLRWRAQQRWRHAIEAELDGIAGAPHLDPAARATALSGLLRRVARLIDPAAVALSGDDWLAFLDRQWPPARREAAPFLTGPARVLADLPYRPAAVAGAEPVDFPTLLALAREWLHHVLPGARAHA
ncbi:MAG: DUF4381 domain-containing protein [Xanthomonadales bacterium]|nr:DUF4381 domain-containing protein [Xanthomonadales bacterium]